MKLSMKSIKHSAFASEETYCYEAVVYLDGKPFAHVRNQGHGGCDDVYPHPKCEYKIAFQNKLQEIEAYFKTLPNTDVGKYDWCPEGFGQTFETWCSAQVFNFLIKKDLQRAMRTKHLFKTADGLFEVRHEVKVERIKRDHPDAIILNDLPIDEALEIYKEATDA
jgi:hypothetical protein